LRCSAPGDRERGEDDYRLRVINTTSDVSVPRENASRVPSRASAKLIMSSAVSAVSWVGDTASSGQGKTNKAGHEIWHGSPVFLPDGQRFVISAVSDDHDDEAAEQAPTRVIVNWPAMIGGKR